MKVNFKYVVIVALFICILVMGTGFSLFSSRLALRGNANLAHPGGNRWSVEIAGVESEATGNAVSRALSYDSLTASFDAVMRTDGDSIKYTISVINRGTLDAELDTFVSDIESEEIGNSGIIYELSGITKGDVLEAGEITTFTVKVSYDADLVVNPLLTSRKYKLTLSYVQKV